MINSTAEGNQLLYRAQPLEFMLHGLVLWLFWGEYQGVIPTEILQQFIAAVLIANGVKLLYVIVHRFFREPSMEGHNMLSTVLLLGINTALGLVWGGGLAYLAYTHDGLMLTQAELSLLMANLLMAGIVGSALWSWLFAYYATALLGPGIFLMYQASQWRELTLWASLYICALVLFGIVGRLEQTFKRYRQMGRQNTGLIKEIAEAKQQAQRNHNEIKSSHEKLKTEMQERKRVEEKIRASERETARILQDMQDTYFRVDANGNLARVSPSIHSLVGLTSENALNKSFASLFKEASEYDTFAKKLRHNAGLLQNYETQLKHLSGNAFWASINAHYSGSQSNGKGGFEGTIRDISESKRAAENLYQEKNRLHVTLESIGDGVITTDVKGIVTYLNPVAETLCGWSLSKAQNKPLSSVLKLVDEENRHEVFLPLGQWIKSGSRGQLSNPVVLISSHKEYTIEVTGSPIRSSDDESIGYVLIFRNMTKLRALTKQLSHQATHDSLTGLINRSEFESRVNDAIRSAKTENKYHALCYIDLDQFKIVNDTCGHHAGDVLLKQVTSMLQHQLRSSDTLARLGGDEFGVLLIGCPMDQAQKVAEAIRLAVEKYRFNWESRSFRIGASIGLVPISPDTQSLEELLSNADAACYVAKESGRNRVHVLEKDDVAIAQQQGQMNLMQRIQRALEEDLFELHIQSIKPISGQVSQRRCAEVLIRMIDETKNSILPPGAFLSTAERYHLMPKIDQWVILNTFRALSQKPQEYKQWDMCSINISGQSLGEKSVRDWVVKAFELTGVPPSMICFEITESAAVENLENALSFLKTLKTMGCRFALDDFGSGVSSFGYLKHLPVDYIKMDGDLVKDAGDNQAGFAVIEAINNIAHVMNLRTIAEHVETLTLMTTLKKIGVDYAQGYAIDRPGLFYTHEKHRKAS